MMGKPGGGGGHGAKVKSMAQTGMVAGPGRL